MHFLHVFSSSQPTFLEFLFVFHGFSSFSHIFPYYIIFSHIFPCFSSFSPCFPHVFMAFPPGLPPGVVRRSSNDGVVLGVPGSDSSSAAAPAACAAASALELRRGDASERSEPCWFPHHWKAGNSWFNNG